MSFWKPTKTKKRQPRPPDTGQAVPAKKKIHRKLQVNNKMRAVKKASRHGLI